jgi:hypothetical protein
MTNVTNLSDHSNFYDVAGNTITLQHALAAGASADSLRAIADWNERKSYDERRRKARARHKAQAVALRGVADALEYGVYMARAA